MLDGHVVLWVRAFRELGFSVSKGRCSMTAANAFVESAWTGVGTVVVAGWFSLAAFGAVFFVILIDMGHIPCLAPAELRD
jgi:hypothetical protein